MPKYTKTVAVIVLVIAGFTFFVKASWATLSVLKSNDAAYQVEEGKTSDIPVNFSQNSKSRAPEPSTIALFASGILGVVIRFVRKSYVAVKRGIDIAGSIFGLVVLSPLCLLAIILIKANSRGPIFYSQTRIGKDGQPFAILKFRSMRVDAEKETGVVWAAINDNRLIPCGKFLRKSHIDEIPQFINVLKGDMSIVGPRPERPVFVEKFKATIPDYEKRIRVKPGITGLAQVWHKYDETLQDVRKKVLYDLLYIRKVCLWTDVRILFRTVQVVLTGKGAR